MAEILKISEIIFYEQIVLEFIIGGIFVSASICITLFLLWLGIKDV